jgi:enoyl-CoA hydratase
LHAAAEQAACEVLQTAPDAREAFKRIVNANYGLVDEVSFAVSLRGPEVREGMQAFAEKRSPSWVPDTLRANGRL